MKVKVCSNTRCDLGSVTTFSIEKTKCPYCSAILKLRNPECELDEIELLKYEEYVNELFRNFNSQTNTLKDFSKYFSFIGNEWSNRKNWSNSLIYFQKALEILTDINGDHDRGIETLHNNLGSVFMELRQPGDAVNQFRKCLVIQKKLYNSQDLLISWTCNNLGNAYFDLGYLEESIDSYKEAIQICEQSNGHDYESLITLYISLGNALLLNQDFYEAINFLKKALHLSDIYLTINDPRKSLLYSQLGECFAGIGDFEKAIIYHKNELEIALALFEDDDLAVIDWKIGNCYQQLNKHTMAIKYYQDGFKKNNNKSGGFPFKIGQCLEAQKELNTALDYFYVSSKIRINDLGPNAQETIEAVNAYNRLAVVLGENYIDINDYKLER